MQGYMDVPARASVEWTVSSFPLRLTLALSKARSSVANLQPSTAPSRAPTSPYL